MGGLKQTSDFQAVKRVVSSFPIPPTAHVLVDASVKTYTILRSHPQLAFQIFTLTPASKNIGDVVNAFCSRLLEAAEPIQPEKVEFHFEGATEKPPQRANNRWTKMNRAIRSLAKCRSKKRKKAARVEISRAMGRPPEWFTVLVMDWLQNRDYCCWYSYGGFESDFAIAERAATLNNRHAIVIVDSVDYDYVALTPPDSVDRLYSTIRGTKTTLSREELLQDLGLTHHQLLLACVLAGCDNAQQKLKRVGFKTARKIARMCWGIRYNDLKRALLAFRSDLSDEVIVDIFAQVVNLKEDFRWPTDKIWPQPPERYTPELLALLSSRGIIPGMWVDNFLIIVYQVSFIGRRTADNVQKRFFGKWPAVKPCLTPEVNIKSMLDNFLESRPKLMDLFNRRQRTGAEPNACTTTDARKIDMAKRSTVKLSFRPSDRLPSQAGLPKPKKRKRKKSLKKTLKDLENVQGEELAAKVDIAMDQLAVLESSLAPDGRFTLPLSQTLIGAVQELSQKFKDDVQDLDYNDPDASTEWKRLVKDFGLSARDDFKSDIEGIAAMVEKNELKRWTDKLYNFACTQLGTKGLRKTGESLAMRKENPCNVGVYSVGKIVDVVSPTLLGFISFLNSKLETLRQLENKLRAIITIRLLAVADPSSLVGYFK